MFYASDVDCVVFRSVFSYHLFGGNWTTVKSNCEAMGLRWAVLDTEEKYVNSEAQM